MKDILMYRRGSRLEPATLMDQDDIFKLPEGRVVTVSITLKRSEPQERFLRALVKLVSDGVGKPPDLVFDQMKFALGMVEPVEDIFGEIKYRLKSTSRAAMPSQIEYNAFVNRVIELVQTHYLAGIKKVTIVREIEKMLKVSDHAREPA